MPHTKKKTRKKSRTPGRHLSKKTGTRYVSAEVLEAVRKPLEDGYRLTVRNLVAQTEFSAPQVEGALRLLGAQRVRGERQPHPGPTPYVWTLPKRSSTARQVPA